MSACLAILLAPLTQAAAARDATEAFEDVGHSDEARALLTDMLVGDFEKTDVRPCLPLLSIARYSKCLCT